MLCYAFGAAVLLRVTQLFVAPNVCKVALICDTQQQQLISGGEKKDDADLQKGTKLHPALTAQPFSEGILMFRCEP